MNTSNVLRYLLKRNNLIRYNNQYETRDFIYKINKNNNYDNYVNYYLTKEFREYKPNLKKYSVADDVKYLKYLNSIK